MQKYKKLIDRINESDLSTDDKGTLVNILSKENVDLNLFIRTFLRICDMASIVSKVCDIDFDSN